MKPIKIDDIDAFDSTRILAESKAEGYGMLERLLRDYRSGKNRFDKAGECLFGIRTVYIMTRLSERNFTSITLMADLCKVKGF